MSQHDFSALVVDDNVGDIHGFHSALPLTKLHGNQDEPSRQALADINVIKFETHTMHSAWGPSILITDSLCDCIEICKIDATALCPVSQDVFDPARRANTISPPKIFVRTSTPKLRRILALANTSVS